MRRRIAAHFAGVASNDDVARYATAVRVLEGEHAWLEQGLTPAEGAPETAATPRVARR